MLNPKIITLPEIKLVGKRRSMSLVTNQTQALWQDFMPYRNEIINRIGNDFYSIQNYTTDYFENFTLEKTFEKWAAVQVSDFESLPHAMESLVIPTGLYAVFEHKGIKTTIFEQIFTKWLPNSNYHLAQRPHFEVLSKKYNKNDPNSGEQIWIPISTKQE